MTTRPVDEAVLRLVRILDAVGVTEWAMTGGVALSVWVEPRETRDLDVLAAPSREAIDRLLAFHDGMGFGPFEVPDIVKFRAGAWDTDLFVAHGDDDRACLARAVPATIGAASVRVVTPEDWVIHKLRKLRTDRRRLLQDLADLHGMASTRGTSMDWRYVTDRVAADELRLVQAVRSLDEDALLQALIAT